MATASHAIRLSAAVLVITVLVALTPATTGVDASESEPPGECTPTLDVTDLASGDLGTGWTVSRDRTREAFDVEVLGVVRDGIAPGRDLIVVDTSGPVVDKVGGIWFGMSGSPVFVMHEGIEKLIGAVAYGFSFGPSTIAGLTPATDLVAVADRPVSGPGPTSASSDPEPGVAKLDLQARQAIATETGVSLSEVGAQLQRLTVPLALPTHPVRAKQFIETLRDRAQRADVRVLPYAVGTSATNGPGVGEFEPGGNFAGVLSYGDLTAAGIGTTSYVCDGKAVAFGHPFLFSGPTTMGANTADALTIVSDPVFGPFKFATVAEGVGTVDQDRLAGIRAVLDVTPPSVPVTSSVTELDDGHHRDGRTDVIFTDFLGDLALFHTVFNIDSVFDQIGGGSAEVNTTVTGTRAGGAPWSLEIGNRFASSFDIAFDALFDLYFDLIQVQANDFEPVAIDSVHVDVDVEGTTRTYQLRSVLVSNDGTTFVPLEEATLQAGRTEHVRAVLRRVDRRNGLLVSVPGEVEVDLAIEIPPDLYGPAILQVKAGPGDFDEDPFECFFDPEACTSGETVSLDDVLDAIQNRPRNDDLVAQLLPADDDGHDDEFEVERFDFDGGTEPLAEARERLDRYATGLVRSEIFVQPFPSSKPAYVRGNRWNLRFVLDEGPQDIAFRFGRSTDIQLMCDWTGQGATPVVVRNGTWHANAWLGGGIADRTFKYGRAGDVPVCGDWNGNGKDSPGVVRGRTWLLRNSMTGGSAQHEFRYGLATDVKVVGDWDGDGKDTPGVRRGTQWLLRNKLSGGSATIGFAFGAASGQAVVGDWNANGKDSVGVVRNGQWRLRNALNAGPADIVFHFGDSGDRFLSWNF